MTDVFVSYSRSDAEFVGQLADALRDRGKDVWIDTAGIEDADVFPQAIRNAIERSDAFLFIITPDSVTSRYCDNEVDYAAELRKRIVPVVRARVADEDVPSAIGERNWIPFTDDLDFDTAVGRVIRALDTDLDYRKEHTRWLTKAIEWATEEQDRSFLLRGSELRAAESWLAQAERGVEPGPTGVQRQYLLASRQANARRQRGVVTLSLVVSAVAIGLLIFALVSRGQAVTAKTTATSQALAAQSQTDLSLDPEASILLAVRALHQAHTPQALLALRQALDTSPFLRELPGHPGISCSFPAGAAVVYRPDGQQLAESLCNEGVLLIDTTSGSVVHKIPTSGQVYSVAYSPDGRTLAVAGTDTTVQVYDAASGALTRTLRGLSAPASVIAFSPDGTKLATKPFGPGALWLFNMATGTGQSVGDINVLGEVLVGSIAFTADGRALVVGSTLPYVAVLDSTTGTVVRRLPLSGGPFGCSPSVVGLGATGTLVVASNPCDGGGTITVWTGAAWTSQYTLTNVGNIGVTSLVVSHDGSRLAIGEYNGTASVWSLTSRTKLVPIVGITTPITDVAFNPAGTEVVTASNDGISRVWRVGGPELLDLTSQVQVVEGLGLQADRLVATGLDGNQIVALVWSIPDGKLRSRFVVERSPSDGALVSADGKFVVGLDPIRSGDVTIWDVAGQRILRTINEPGTVLAAWSPDDRHVALVSGGPRSAPVVLDVASGKTVDMAGPIPSCYSNDATYPAFSGHGGLLAFSTFCGQVTVWDTATGKQVATFDDRAEASSLAFSPDGSRIAVGSWDGNLTVWQVQTSKAVLSVVADVQAVERGGVAYSADGHWIVTTHGDGTARVWDARTAHLLRIDTHPGTAEWVAFGPGDKTLATTDDQGVIRLWDACSACGDAKALLALAQQRTVQHPTPLESAILTGRD